MEPAKRSQNKCELLQLVGGTMGCSFDEACSDTSHWKPLLKKLLTKAAPVALGIKPALLLRLEGQAEKDNEPELAVFDRHREDILRLLALACRQMRRSERGALLLFYDPRRLEQVLFDPCNRAFLRQRHFDGASLEELLDALVARFETDPTQFVHEVGLFLGYPLKDVQGYIRGDQPQPIPRTLWRVYGEPSASLSLMAAIVRAEGCVDRVLQRLPEAGRWGLHEMLHHAA